MQLMDVFSKEDRIELMVSQFESMMRAKVERDLLIKGLQLKIQTGDLLRLFLPLPENKKEGGK